ncbi:MAG: hypothetical protein ACFFAN_16845 [Promethearchaeota archaeon]
MRYSCDIGNKKIGIEIINLAKKYSILDKVEITDTRLRVLSYLNNIEPKVNLVYTIPSDIKKVNDKNINFEKLNEINV